MLAYKLNAETKASLDAAVQKIGYYDKLFITGTYGVGKTTFAEVYSQTFDIPFHCFDNTFHSDLATDSNYVNTFLNEYPPKFVSDAVPYLAYGPYPKIASLQPSIDTIKKWENCHVVVLTCSNLAQYIDRVIVSKTHAYCGMLDGTPLESGMSLSDEDRLLILNNVRVRSYQVLLHLHQFYDRYLRQYFDNDVTLSILDTVDNSFITKERVLELQEEVRQTTENIFNYNCPAGHEILGE